MVAHEDSVGIESSIAVDKDLKWKVFIQGKEIKELPQSLEAVPSIVSSISVLHKIMTILCSSIICVASVPGFSFMQYGCGAKNTAKKKSLVDFDHVGTVT